MKHFIVLLLSVFCFHAYGQQVDTRTPLSIKVGLGAALSGSGDVWMTTTEGAFDWKVNRFLTPSVSIMFGRGDNGTKSQSSMMQANTNLFYSPFGNDRFNNFRVGIGYSVMSISQATLVSTTFDPDANVTTEMHALESNFANGVNVMIDNEMKLSDHFVLGFGVFTRIYDSGDVLTGGQVKVGLEL